MDVARLKFFLYLIIGYPFQSNDKIILSLFFYFVFRIQYSFLSIEINYPQEEIHIEFSSLRFRTFVEMIEISFVDCNRCLKKNGPKFKR